jgi:phage repressor protein C with HTH and peptisase S24 domain
VSIIQNMSFGIMSNKDHNNERQEHNDGLTERLREAMGEVTQAELARRVGVTKSSISSYLGGSAPSFLVGAALADALGVEPRWLATGIGPVNADHEATPILIPRYDVMLSAGAGAWSDRAQQIGSLAFQRSYLAKLGAADGKGLIVLGMGGDSMAPTLRDGATVLVQTNLTGWEDGVWAFAQDNLLRLKRLQRGLSKLTIISDNPQYAPEELPSEEADALQLIGKCKWAGQSL